jgi:uncharacterized protein (DUF2062 family)
VTEQQKEKRSKRELVRDAWRRLRGGELTPLRAAASIAIGLAVGVTPLWGAHWAIILAICLPLRLDAGIALLASQISLPFIAPFITLVEIEVGARVLRGSWLALRRDDLKTLDLSTVASEVAIGTLLVAAGAAAIGGSIGYAVVSIIRRRAKK